MKEFGAQAYDQVVYVNLELNAIVRSLFDADFDVQRIIAGIQIATGLQVNPINTPLINNNE